MRLILELRIILLLSLFQIIIIKYQNNLSKCNWQIKWLNFLNIYEYIKEKERFIEKFIYFVVIEKICITKDGRRKCITSLHVEWINFYMMNDKIWLVFDKMNDWYFVRPARNCHLTKTMYFWYKLNCKLNNTCFNRITKFQSNHI